MKVLKPRSRMISIRLSEAEYDELCRFSATTGARSLSDLAREAMRQLLRTATDERLSSETAGGFQAQMDRLSRRIDELQDRLISPEPRPEEKSS